MYPDFDNILVEHRIKAFQLDTAKRLTSKIVVKVEKVEAATQTRGDTILKNIQKEFTDKLEQLNSELEESEKLKNGKLPSQSNLDLEKQNSILTDELSKISKEKGNAILSQKSQQETITELGIELDQKSESLHRMKTSYDYIKTSLDVSK